VRRYLAIPLVLAALRPSPGSAQGPRGAASSRSAWGSWRARSPVRGGSARGRWAWGRACGARGSRRGDV